MRTAPGLPSPHRVTDGNRAEEQSVTAGDIGVLAEATVRAASFDDAQFAVQKAARWGAERHRAHADLIGSLIIQDGILGAGLRAHASGARFGTCVDSSEQCSAKIFILLTISSSPEFFGYFKLHRRTFSPSSRHDAIPLGLCGPLCSSIPRTPGNELNLLTCVSTEANKRTSVLCPEEHSRQRQPAVSGARE